MFSLAPALPPRALARVRARVGSSRSSRAARSSSVRAAVSDAVPSSPADAPRDDAPRRRVSARDFRHPLDQQNTQLLQAIPGLSQITKSLVTPVAERMLVLEQISTSVLVGPNQLPHIHQLVLDAAEVLDVTPPQLYIRQSSQPNAYTLAISGQKPVVVVHTALVELLTAAELQAVIAHELGHLKCDHGVWLTVANLLTMGAEITPLVPVLRRRQFSGRTHALGSSRRTLVRPRRAPRLGRPDVVVSVLMKLSGGTPKLAGQLNVDAFLDQARGYDEASNSPLGWYLRNAQTRQLSHPLPVARAREIDAWAGSGEYARLGVKPAPEAARIEQERASRGARGERREKRGRRREEGGRGRRWKRRDETSNAERVFLPRDSRDVVPT